MKYTPTYNLTHKHTQTHNRHKQEDKKYTATNQQNHKKHDMHTRNIASK